MHRLELPASRTGVVARGAEPPYVCFAASPRIEPEECWVSTSGEVSLFLKLPAGSRTDVTLTTIALTEWNEAVEAHLLERLGR
jgi:hypothetical protein